MGERTNTAARRHVTASAGEPSTAEDTARFWEARFEAHRDCSTCPSLADVRSWFEGVFGLLFEQHALVRFASFAELEAESARLEKTLTAMVADSGRAATDAKAVSSALQASLPEIHQALVEDADATVRADPAARDRDEVVRAYPGFYATAAYRMAHVLQLNGARLLARMVSASAHRVTGIDIHPAAVIGRRFCIDHGTGVVIGETAVLGDDVILYQGVTLGGLSVKKADAASKRHPTIGDRVVIYSGATILGGDTTVGHDSVIGGNVWLTHAVPPFSKLTYRASIETVVGAQSGPPEAEGGP